ncbi:MAG: ATP-binding protein [Planctomycetota bacterium]
MGSSDREHEVATLAHDLKNLLASVVGHADLQLVRLRAEAPGSDLTRSLEAIRLSAGRAAQVCEEILAVSGGGRRVREPVELGSVARAALQLLRARTDTEFRGRADGPAGLCVRGSRLALERAVLNLLWNALEACGDTGREPAEIEIAWGRGHSGPWIEVRDNGPGLPGGILGTLSRPFQSSRPGPGGPPGGGAGVRGLGLYAAARILREHGGRLTGRNRRDRSGAVLRLEFGLERELEFEAGGGGKN